MYKDNAEQDTWDKVAKNYQLQINTMEEELASEINSILMKLNIKKEDRLIELGCGSGHISLLLNQLGYKTDLVDFSDEALKKSKEIFDKYGLDAKILKKDITQELNIDQKYKVAWNSGVLEHFDDNTLNKIIKNIKDIDSEYFIFIVPNPKSLIYLLFRYKLMSENKWEYGKEYLRENYIELVEMQGLKLIETCYMGENFTIGHMKAYLDDEQHDIEYLKDMFKYDIVDNSQKYLVAYIFSKNVSNNISSIDIKNKIESKSECEYKTVISDLINEKALRLKQYNAATTEKSVLEKEKSVLEKEKSVLEKEKSVLENKKSVLENKIRMLEEKNHNIYVMLEKEKELINSLNLEKESLNNALYKIYSSTLWKVALRYYKLRDNTFLGLPHRVLKKIKNKTEIKSRKSIENIYESKAINPKNKTVFIFAGVAYYDIGGGQRSAQLAKTFYKLGYDVHYIYAYDSSEETKLNINMQLKNHIHIDNIDERFIKNNISDSAFFIFEIPHIKFYKYLEFANDNGIKTVYEHIDNWETSLGGEWFNLNIYYKFLNKADVLVATAVLLQEKLQETVLLHCDNKSKIVEYLPNAVDSELFESLVDRERPLDLKIGEKTLIYYGSLWGEWFDWNLVFGIAKKFPSYEINLIGEYAGIKEKYSEIPSNIHFLGLKEQVSLPSYLKYSDIAILPFKNCEIGKYVSPLKIFEYICMGKYVISTKLPDIEDYPNVSYGDTLQEWIDILSNNNYELDRSYVNFIDNNNWYKRCYDLESLTSNRKKYNRKISVIILNRNNMKTIFRCVDSLIYNNDYNYEIIVVDNDSTDGSYEILKEKYKNIILLKNNKNGCSSGRNLGVRNSSGEILIFLDSDQWVLTKNWIDNAINILNDNKEIGSVGWAAGWFSKGSVGGPICDYLDNRGISKNDLFRTDVAYLGTGGMVVYKEIFDLINGFDEKFDPTCYEDTDFSLKIKNLGFKLAYCPFLPIFHLPHQTTNSGDEKHKALMNKNGKYFQDKWNYTNKKLLKVYLSK